MTTKKNYPILQLLIIRGVSLVTTFALIGETIINHTQVFPAFANAVHAAADGSVTCAITKGTQSTLCEHQDPIQQGCVPDAITLDLQTIFHDIEHTKPLGEVELRYSPMYQTYWVRTTAFLTAKGIIKTIHADITFRNQTKEDSEGTPTFPDPRFAYVAWTDMTVAPLLHHAGAGSFDIIGQSQPLTVFFQ